MNFPLHMPQIKFTTYTGWDQDCCLLLAILGVGVSTPVLFAGRYIKDLKHIYPIYFLLLNV